MAILVLFVFVGLTVICSLLPRRQGIREALLRAALLFGAIVALATEVLSLFDALTAAKVTVVWLMLAATVGTTAILARARTSAPRSTTEGRSSIPLLSVLACATILGGTLVVAVMAPPNYADALSYHMGRVAHWIQAGSVDYYPTAIDRQNYQMPFAEFVILHLQLLSGGDRWANVVQWAAFALSGMTVSLVLAELGQSTRVHWAGALVAFTIPMAILEASGAQNDLVVSLWLLAFLLYLWRGLSDRSLESSLLCGLALGIRIDERLHACRNEVMKASCKRFIRAEKRERDVVEEVISRHCETSRRGGRLGPCENHAGPSAGFICLRCQERARLIPARAPSLF